MNSEWQTYCQWQTELSDMVAICYREYGRSSSYNVYMVAEGGLGIANTKWWLYMCAAQTQAVAIVLHSMLSYF